MASGATGKYTEDSLKQAVDAVHDGKLSLRKSLIAVWCTKKHVISVCEWKTHIWSKTWTSLGVNSGRGETDCRVCYSYGPDWLWMYL